MKIAYDSNTYRCELLIPFLILNKNKFQIMIPAIIYAEKGYSFLLKGESYSTFKDEINSYNGKIMPLTSIEIEKSIELAQKYRKQLPFKVHSRDYLIAGQCEGKIDLFITYNKKHFEIFNLNSTEILDPEEFIAQYISN